MEIKAIETVYNGYRFRSRLEARWAVFFDAMGIKWQYEAEGYDLGDLGWYLPDFWLPDHKWHAEVKPGEFSEVEFAKAYGIGKTVILDGMPENRPYFLARDDDNDYGYQWYYYDNYPFPNNGDSYYGTDFFYHGFCNFDDYYRTEIDYAVRCAKSARFEHGDTPDFLPITSPAQFLFFVDGEQNADIIRSLKIGDVVEVIGIDAKKELPVRLRYYSDFFRATPWNTVVVWGETDKEKWIDLARSIGAASIFLTEISPEASIYSQFRRGILFEFIGEAIKKISKDFAMHHPKFKPWRKN